MTRQFDVFRNPLRRDRSAKPFVVCVQHRNLNHLGTRVVAPLVTGAPAGERSRLYPIIMIEQKSLHFDPTEVIALPAHLLGSAVTNLEDQRDAIIAALDLVFTGI